MTLEFCTLAKCGEDGKMLDQTLGSVKCSCHPNCQVRGTCCYNYLDHLKTVPKIANFVDYRELQSASQCGMLTGVRYSVSIVNRCTRRDSPHALRCNAKRAEIVTVRNLWDAFPISYAGLLYKNQACALCYNDDIHPRKFGKLKISVQCEYGLILHIEDDVPVSLITSFCAVYHHSEVVSKNLCFDSDDICPLETASADNEGKTMHHLCRTYLSPFSSDDISQTPSEFIGFIGYKNPFCAMCTGRRNFTTQCPLRNRQAGSYTHQGLHLLFSLKWRNFGPAHDASDYRAFYLTFHVNFTTAIRNETIIEIYTKSLIEYRLSKRMHNMTNVAFSDLVVASEKQPITQTHRACFVSLRLKMRNFSLDHLARFILGSAATRGFISDRNIRVKAMKATLAPQHGDLRPTCTGTIVKSQEGDYVIISGPIDYVEILSTRARYRTDDDDVYLTYYIDRTKPDDIVIVRTSLTLCTTDYSWAPIASRILTALSLVGLLFVVATHFKFKRLRTTPGLNLTNMCCTMAVALTVWYAFANSEAGSLVCTTVAIILHYTWLSAFMWMSVTGFDTWYTFRPHMITRITLAEIERTTFGIYCAYAYGLPFVITGIGLVLTYCVPELKFSYGDRHLCWLGSPYQIVATFLMPVALVSVTNTGFFVAILVNLLKLKNETKITAVRNPVKTRLARDFLPFVKLPVLLGVSWLLGILGSVVENKLLWTAFDLMNGSQGIFIFLVFVSSRRILVLYGWAGGDRTSSKQTGNSSTRATSSFATKF